MKWMPNNYKRKLRREQQKDWHRWYAWRPVVIRENEENPLQPRWRVWLEHVERMRNPNFDYIDPPWRKFLYRPDTTQVTQ